MTLLRQHSYAKGGFHAGKGSIVHRIWCQQYIYPIHNRFFPRLPSYHSVFIWIWNSTMTATWWRWVSDLWWEEEEYTRHHGITTNYTPLLILGRSTLIGRGQQRYCALIGWFSVFVLGVLTLVCVVVTVLRLARINSLSQVSFQSFC